MPLTPDAFARAADAFEDARTRTAVRDRRYRVADRILRVRVAGPALADALETPFEHLRADASTDAPFLSIDVWHEAETGIRRPGAAVDPELGPYGIMTASVDGRSVAEQRPHSAGWLDRGAGRAIVWVSSVEQLHLDERARPFHRFLALSLGQHGVQIIHAGLVSREGRGALFTGVGGAGKSTASISCLLDGFDYLGDDFIGLESVDDGSFRGHSLYCTALIGLGHMSGFPALAQTCAAGHHAYEDKSVARLGGLADARFAASSTIHAIVLPAVRAHDESTTCERASAREAMFALAPSSVLYLPAAGPRSMDRLGALVERVPSFRLLLGRDVTRIPERVREILAESRSVIGY